ncbi:hypothetical protein PsorP6_008490 [Peronosclerospora sorghi]|uniref:Uncharacterized protein n=1 Tax=Peronosclerospora sorghi TaxID=230839 RepID=A0ACC0W7U8_9STRA|nr:hypothetical protein PsorP6_008490 [Peronosclerospora sorghi]
MAESTTYGTNSPASDDTLDVRSSARRQWMRWAFIGALVSILTIGVVVQVVSSNWNQTIEIDTSTAEGDITCFQSSYDSSGNMAGLRIRTPLSRCTRARLSKRSWALGGAFTEAASLQFHRFPRENKEEVLTLYFDKEHGSTYSFGRVPMGSCDFSLASYNFDETANDIELVHFDVDVTHDVKTMIPFIKRTVER